MKDPERAAPILVLFDIDGTLLDLHGAGRKAFAQALEQVFGWCDELAYIVFAGATDLDVLEQIFRRHQRTLTARDAEQFFDALPRHLEITAEAAEITVYPGVSGLVDELARHPGVTIGLVTGNIERCARIKLERAGLHQHFELGAFGHEHGDRRVIAELAIARCAATLPPGTAFRKKFLIGDTPSDIRAAHHIGAVSIAVATGHHTRADLLAAGAQHVLDSLEGAASLLLA
ncbi:MAG TPA: HAD hydrolase-like protein [Kiritimatiellia bacterium]|nr:HAD hydrolase-like protein [Kiritimatiellia bacterium]HMO99227.1 HAD hydrolase-like protein [Kiritimatiellia bacterium]HMP97485.1 HAD hydrolase-like protein [Kiritimatiellia bacterium]